MNYKNYLQQSSNLFAENKLLKVGFVILLIMTVVNWQQVQNMTDKEKVVLMPMGATGNLWISNNAASEDYILFMTRYIMHQLGDYTAANVRSQYNELIRFFTPDQFVTAKKQLETIAKEIERFSTAAAEVFFSQKDIKHDAINQKIKIHAMKHRFLNGVKAGSERKTYLIEYTINHGRFWIRRVLEEKTREKVPDKGEKK